MAEVEVPDPNEVVEKAADPFTRRVALFVAVYAVGMAVTALGGSNAGKDMVMAQQKASNQWAYYQAKVVRENMYQLAAETLELEIEEVNTPWKKEAREKKLAEYRKKAATYKAEKEEIMAEAKKLEEERDTAARRDPYFDYAEVLLQIAIVCSSVAILATSRPMLFVSLALAVVGVLMTVNGFLLAVKIPFLQPH